WAFCTDPTCSRRSSRCRKAGEVHIPGCPVCRLHCRCKDMGEMFLNQLPCWSGFCWIEVRGPRTLIQSPAKHCLRAARRISLMTCPAGAFPVPDFCLIFAPFKGYDEPQILRSQLRQVGPISADA